jgi:hypothetical protein
VRFLDEDSVRSLFSSTPLETQPCCAQIQKGMWSTTTASVRLLLRLPVELCSALLRLPPIDRASQRFDYRSQVGAPRGRPHRTKTAAAAVAARQTALELALATSLLEAERRKIFNPCLDGESQVRRACNRGERHSQASGTL